MRHGTDNGGERGGKAKLTSVQARIIDYLERKHPRKLIASAFNVSVPTVERIAKRMTWKKLIRIGD